MKLYARGWWDWPAIVRPSQWNWVDFRVIHFSWEWTKYTDSFSVDLGLLGFSVEITLRWRPAPPRGAQGGEGR